MNRRAPFLVALALLIPGSSVRAEPPAPTPSATTPVAPAAPTPKEAAAAELCRVIGLERTMMASATAIMDAQLQQKPMLLPYRDVLLKWAQTYLTWDVMAPRFVAIYAETFSEAEMREIIDFYKTPTGQKALAEMPGLLQKGASIGAEVANEHAPELQQMIQRRSEELDKAAKKPETEGS